MSSGARTCEDCGRSIRDRAPNARLCWKCAADRVAASKRRYEAKRRSDPGLVASQRDSQRWYRERLREAHVRSKSRPDYPAINEDPA